MSTNRIKIAYGSVPKDCGTFTFYRNLKPGLAKHGIEMYCVSVGREETRLWNDSFADEGCVKLASDETDYRRQSQAFVDWAIEHQIHVVMPINSVGLLSAIPHLPSSVRVVMRCANAFDHGYRITATCPNRASRIVATTPRHVNDLTASYDVPGQKIRMIPHGIASADFAQAASLARGTNREITLGFLGRIEHKQKGALYLPAMVEALGAADVPFKLKIAGAGEHEPMLAALLAEAVKNGTVQFAGRIQPCEVPQFLATVDVFLFPSHFEGFGFSLIEAMMAGCVPIASRIEGITDFIIADHSTGRLCETGNARQFADTIQEFHQERDRLAATGFAASQAARERFSCERMAAEYAALFATVVEEKPVSVGPRPWSEFRVDPNFSKGWRDVLRKPVKQLLRGLRLVLPAAPVMKPKAALAPSAR